MIKFKKMAASIFIYCGYDSVYSHKANINKRCAWHCRYFAHGSEGIIKLTLAVGEMIQWKIIK